MDYKKCDKTVNVLCICAILIMGIALLAKSVLLWGLGSVCVLMPLPIRISYWKCPHCAAPLPWDRRIRQGKYPYRCTHCGKEIEF